MSKHLSEDEKKNIVNRYLQGESVNSLSKEVNISGAAIYLWIKQYNDLPKEKNIQSGRA